VTRAIRPPAPRPCETCPYRRDVPAGVWSADEYAKLPAYDRPTQQQPPAVFLCHQHDGRACAGWAGCHDADELLALRLAPLRGDLSPETVEAIRAYRSPVPLHPSGQAAAEYGRAGLAGDDGVGLDEDPVRLKLLRQHPGIQRDDHETADPAIEDQRHSHD
jgi:hypothetical protein